MLATSSLGQEPQVPQKISYQGFLSTGGVPVADGNYTLKFEIFDVTAGGTALYSETQSGVALSQGSFSVIIGSVTPLTLPFNVPYFLEVTATAGPGIGSPLTFSPRAELTSAPYALQSLSLQGPGSEATGTASVAGGENNTASGTHSIVAGGGFDSTGVGNSATGDYSAIVGGFDNVVAGDQSFIGGGGANRAGNISAGYITLGGGANNIAMGNASSILGGEHNTASGVDATVGGGAYNNAGGQQSTIPGGWSNAAKGNRSLAAGTSGKANHHGAVVISANSNLFVGDSVASGGDEQMILRADAGLYITNTGGVVPLETEPARLISTSAGAYLTTTGSLYLPSQLLVGSGGASIIGNTGVTGNVTASGSVAVGAGTPMMKVLSASASVNIPLVLAGFSSSFTITVTGASDGDAVFLGVPNVCAVANVSYFAYVSAVNTVTVRLTNFSGAGIDPPAGTFRVAIIQF